jgi:hypothetical protein
MLAGKGIWGSLAWLTKARAMNRWTTGSDEERATAMFADGEVGSFSMTFGVVGTLGAGESQGLMFPSDSCSFLSLWHLEMSWPCILQWVQHFFTFLLSLSLVFLAALVKNAVLPIPDSQIQCCSLAKIWALSSAGKGSSLAFARTVFKVPREAGRANMIAGTITSSPKFQPRFLTAWTKQSKELI